MKTWQTVATGRIDGPDFRPSGTSVIWDVGHLGLHPYRCSFDRLQDDNFDVCSTSWFGVTSRLCKYWTRQVWNSNILNWNKRQRKRWTEGTLLPPYCVFEKSCPYLCSQFTAQDKSSWMIIILYAEFTNYIVILIDFNRVLYCMSRK